jgi:uncharacterized protein (TIGR01777 family)
MKVLIAGASGFLGKALAADLPVHGHSVSTLVRRPAAAASEIEWHPDRGELAASALEGVDAVISLSGAGVSDKRWNAAYKRELLDSRVQPTATIAATLAALSPPDRPRAFLSASAIGYYGERGDEPLSEAASAGTGFLADLVQEWEAATAPAAAAGVRVATLRTGLVLSVSGGLLKRLVPLFKLGAGGKLGPGTQYQAWISLADEIAAIRHILESESISGPVNLAGPQPVTNKEFSQTLAKVLHRPALAPAPAFALRLALGEFADEGVLISQRVIPEKLCGSGFRFQHEDVHAALVWATKN